MIIFQDIDELATLRQENEQLKQSLEKEQKLGTDLRTEISRLQKVLFDFDIWAQLSFGPSKFQTKNLYRKRMELNWNIKKHKPSFQVFKEKYKTWEK